MTELTSLQEQYYEDQGRLNQFCDALAVQLEQLLAARGLTLAVPMERRVKSWDSIAGKLKRNALPSLRLLDLGDLIGVRAILLFTRDVTTARRLVESSFKILAAEDTSARLTETQFGYQSWHYLLTFPDSWFSMPAYARCRGLRAELQLRTVAQHLWAAASHKLQYKAEQSVPAQLRRSIHRVSALLEIVDREFDAVLCERDEYLKNEGDLSELNVELVRAALAILLPEENKEEDEPYAELVHNLRKAGVNTLENFVALIDKHVTQALENDKRLASRSRDDPSHVGTTRERTERGVYFTHVGLAREILRLEFGDLWRF